MAEKTKIMIVGAGKYQVPLIEKAKSRNLYTIVVSPDGPYPGLALADKVCFFDVRDEEAVLKVAREEQIDGIITDQTDIAVRTVAYVAEQMGLPGIGYETATLFTDKVLMRDKCRQLGIPTIRYKCVSDYEEALEFYREQDGDAIIKPVDNQGSRGIYRIDSEEKLQECFDIALRYSGCGRVVIETFIVGREFEVDSIVCNNEVKVLMHADLNPFSIPDVFASTTIVYPSQAEKTVLTELLKTNHDIITGFGISQGLVHSEYIMDKNGVVYLVETAARGGGLYISSHIAPLQTGLDTSDFLLDIALGRLTAMPEFETERCVCACLTFYLPAGVVSSADGIEEVRDMNSVDKDSLDDIHVGMKTEHFSDKTARYVLIVKAENREKLAEQIEAIKQKLQIKVETDDGIKGPIWE